MTGRKKAEPLRWYNKLLSRAQRASMWGQVEHVERLMDEHRSSGRSTQIALTTLARAIGHPGEWIECRDHVTAASALQGSDNVANLVMSIAAAMQLKYIEKRRFVGDAHSSIRSNHMTQNPWEVI